MSPVALTAFVHDHTPHTKLALYLACCICALGSVVIVYARCWMTDSMPHLQEGWLIRTLAAAAPIPIYALLPLVPVDQDLVDVLKEDQIVLLLAGGWALVATMKDVRRTAGDAHIWKKHHEDVAIAKTKRNRKKAATTLDVTETGAVPSATPV